MTQEVDRNFNRNDIATINTVTVNSLTSTKIADVNPKKRTFLNISLDTGEVDVVVFIKLQAASVDDDKKGIMIGVETSGNNNIFKLGWEMPPDNIYTGEISAITELGSTELHITEY